ncbi:hypothetical protein evm_013910 [Chilo suppressalis]|nr:hypothetical protein evm_013910 [Chilo suppressalis]
MCMKFKGHSSNLYGRQEVGSSTSGRVQAACTVALLEAASCASRGGVSREDVACLLAGLQNPLEVVRDAALRALLRVVDGLPSVLEDPECALEVTERLLVATFDVAEDNKKLAEDLWSRLPLAQQWSREPELMGLVLHDVQHPAEPIQRAAAKALAALVKRDPDPAAPARAAQQLQRMYSEKLPLIPAKLDQFGHVVEGAVDEWGARRGAGVALGALAELLAPHHVPDAITFYVERGLADRHEAVRAEMLTAAMAVVELHGKETLSSQLPVFENFLDKAPKSGGYDAVRQSVVLLVGSLARHLEPGDARIKPITLRLVAALSTPSQQVQEAVSNCLPHLVSSPALEDEIPAIMNKLMKQLLTAEKYGDRKGAAYGIAGIIKGLGILSLKQLDVMGKLTEAIQEKKNYKYREGALFGFEMLCYKLGRLFEPYIVHVLPHLLLCFGDSSQYVRAAADDTAKLIMSKLSAHGVKLVLPSLLQALQDDNWRTKAAIVPVLLQALQDPSNKTSACLQTLLDTKFVHFIDAPSLALIMPVVQRAFLDRSTETRKMAAQIIGNMYSLTDQKDLMPYLPNIIPGLKSSLLDPVPEVRSVSARALGAMVKGMGESSFEELLPWLMHTLTSESSSVDRSGAAQGLSEVVAGLGVHKLHKIMPDIIATAERTDIAPHVKDGYIMMFIYMPGAFTDEFTPYIGQIINPILKALADENEYVRETALKAGQRIVTLYAESAITLLLPELERGLFDDNWRIRYSSVQLLGDLLYRISGVSGKMSTETASEDDNFGTEHSHKAIMSALGAERRNRVLAGLYMGRSDVALMVRQAALHVWKPINVPTAGAQAFTMDGIGRLGHDPPRGPSADRWVLTTADAAGTNGLTYLPKHGGARDSKFLVTHPMTDCETLPDDHESWRVTRRRLKRYERHTRHYIYHHQPINVPTVGAQAFPMDGIGRLGHDPPRGPSADCIIDTLLEWVRTMDEEKRRAGAALLCAFVTHTRADLSPHVPALIRGLILLLAGDERDVLQMAWEALAAVTRSLDAERMVAHVSDVRHALRVAAADLPPPRLLPGFCLPKGIAPILPLFRESILNGLPEDKENAALMLGEVIKLTSPAAIQPSVVHITGPLIRILGDRFNSSVKAAVLETLASLLSKVGAMLKQFLPQLQTTFLKALNDPNRAVRMKAGLALSQLVLIHTRADPLFVELHNGIKNTDDPAIRETMLQALRGIISGGGDKMSEPLALSVLTTLSGPLLAQPEESARAGVGGCLGALLARLPPAHRPAALQHHVLGAPTDNAALLHGRSCALYVALKEAPALVYTEPFQERIEKTLLSVS